MTADHQVAAAAVEAAPPNPQMQPTGRLGQPSVWARRS
jgi:hypothetical protein